MLSLSAPDTPRQQVMTELCSHIIYLAKEKEKAFEANSPVLYFFCSSARKARRWISLTHTVLHQLVCNSSARKANTIADTFLSTLVDGHFGGNSTVFRKDDPLDQTVEKILAAPDNELIEALAEALKTAGIGKLSIIVDGLWDGVTDLFVKFIMDSQLEFNALITCRHNSLQNIPDGMLYIEYDKERKGLQYLPFSSLDSC